MFPSTCTEHLKLASYTSLGRELVSARGVQSWEDARNLTSLRARRRSPGGLEQPPGGWRRKISRRSPTCVTQLPLYDRTFP